MFEDTEHAQLGVTEDTDETADTAGADEETTESSVSADTDAESEESEDVVVDLDSAAAYEQRVDELEALVEEQGKQIAELEDLLMDLSVRAADDRGMGVCPDCHGPVEKVDPWFGSARIECRRCGEVYHEY